MKGFLNYQRVMFTISAIGGCGVVAGLLVCRPDNPALAWGVALGCAVGLVKFRLDVLSILRLAEGEKPGVKVAAHFRSYALMAGTLVAALLMRETFNPWATFGGLMIPRVLLIADGILRPGALALEASESSPNLAGGPEAE